MDKLAKQTKWSHQHHDTSTDMDHHKFGIFIASSWTLAFFSLHKPFEQRHRAIYGSVWPFICF